MFMQAHLFSQNCSFGSILKCAIVVESFVSSFGVPNLRPYESKGFNSISSTCDLVRSVKSFSFEGHDVEILG